MGDFNGYCEDLVNNLKLLYEPVGVTLYRKEDPLPVDIPLFSENLKSYCHAIVIAGEGRTLLLKKEQMGCKLGTSVLGFEDDMAAYLDDGVLEKFEAGLFGTEKASAETILKSTYLEKGKTQAALIAPSPLSAKDPRSLCSRPTASRSCGSYTP